MENEKQKKILFALIPIVIALLSFFVIARFTSSTEFNAKTIQSLDDKKTTVMELAAASTAASAAITLIPGDVGTVFHYQNVFSNVSRSQKSCVSMPDAAVSPV